MKEKLEYTDKFIEMVETVQEWFKREDIYYLGTRMMGRMARRIQTLIEEEKKKAVEGFIDHLQPYIDRDMEWYPVTREFFEEEVETYLKENK